MGTRSLTVFYDLDHNKEIAVLYRQMDGYFEGGHGEDLVKFLAGKRIVNGLPMNAKDMFNGMGCLTASVVAYFKTESGHIQPGDFYLYPAETRNVDEEFIYYVYGSAGDSQATVWMQGEGKHKRILGKRDWLMEFKGGDNE